MSRPNRPARPAPEPLEGRRLLSSFDFGTPRSPTAPAHVRVTAATRFTPARGYGWRSATVSHADRRGANPLRRDVNLTADNTFAMTVPDGTYDVTIVLGDAARAHDRIAVSLEGVPRDTVTTPRGQFADRTYRTTVQDGRLDLHLKDTGGRRNGAAIAGLKITPIVPASPSPAPTSPGTVTPGGSSQPGATGPPIDLPASTGPTVFVGTTAELRQALHAARPGTTILLRPGDYEGGIWHANLRGTPEKPITVGAADPAHKPIFRGGVNSIMLVDPAYVELRDLILDSPSIHGLNIDDGGSYATPAHHVILRNIEVRNSGPDAIKLAGVDQFLITGCTVDGWKSTAVDLVGSHDGIVENGTFRGNRTDTFGIQAKGGSRNVTIRNNLVQDAGFRGIQIGGHTDAYLMRPEGVNYEAKDILVEGNVIVGGKAAVAFASMDGSVFRNNTIIKPTQWVVRILQDDGAASIVPSRNGVFTDNIVVFESRVLQSFVNVGVGTAPETFRFAGNWWYATDDPTRSRPTGLPTPEIGGISGLDPQFLDATTGNYRLKPGSPASAYGAYARRR